MTGTTRSSEGLAPERRRALFRAWHRGTREMDLVLGGFADDHIETLSQAEFDEFEAILAEQDTELLKWVTGEAPTPADRDTPLFRRIAAHPRGAHR